MAQKEFGANRRDFIKLLSAAMIAPGPLWSAEEPERGLVLTLPTLPYAFDALEPYIDAETMRLHHDKHHQAYLNNLIRAVEEAPQLRKYSLEKLLMEPELVPEKLRSAVRNHGGGHFNHSFFWLCLRPKGEPEPQGPLAAAMVRDFGSFPAFRETFTRQALGLFGSGWVWLVASHGKLSVTTTPNQDTPLSSGMVPLLGLDLWEHAYYLRYQWRRPAYVEAFWHVVNWPFVAQRFQQVARV